MFQKGRGEQPIKYKSEVLKKYPEATWEKNHSNRGAIFTGIIRISEYFHAPWQAWENAYYRNHLNNPKITKP